MTELTDAMVRRIQARAAEKMAAFAAEMVRAKPENQEAILAGLEFERWLEEACRQALD